MSSLVLVFVVCEAEQAEELEGANERRTELTLLLCLSLSPFRLLPPLTFSWTLNHQAEAYKRDDPSKALKQESLNEAHREVLDKEVKGGAAKARGG